MAKKIGFSSITILLVAGILSNGSLAQNQGEWHFTEGAKMRLGKGRINDIQFSPDGRRFAVASSIGIWMYDAHTGEELSLIAVLPGEGRDVTTAAFSPDGKTLASGEEGGIGRLWDVTTGKPIATFKEVPAPQYAKLRALAFSANGTKLIGAVENGEINIWKLGEDINLPTLLKTIEGQKSWHGNALVLLSPDTRLLANTTEDWKNRIFQIHLWDTSTGKYFRTLTHTRWIKSIAFSADSKMLVSGDEYETIRLWDTKTGELQATLNWRHGTSTYALAFSPSGRFIASGHREGVKLWDNTVKPKQRTDNAIGDYQHTLELRGHKDYVSKLAFSPDGKTLLTGSKDGTIHAWDPATGSHRYTVTGHIEGIMDLIFTQNSNTVVSLNEPFNPPGNLQQQRWDLNTGDQLSTRFWDIDAVGTMTLSPDGKTLAVHAFWDDFARDNFALWDIYSDPPRIIDQFALDGPPKSALNVNVNVKFAFSADGKMLAAGGEDKFVHIWQLTDAKKVRHRFTVNGHKHWIRTLAFSPDGELLASGGEGGTLCLWRVADGTSLFRATAHKWRINVVVFSPDGKILASGGNELFFWDTTTGTQLRTPPRRLTAPLSTLVFSPDGNTLVAGNWDGIIELWDVRTGGLLSTHTGHTRWINVLKFSPDGQTLVSASRGDSTILLWDWETLKKTGNR